MELERNSHCKTVYKWIRRHADTAYKSSRYCMCVSNLTWNDPKKTHRNLSLKEDLSLATKHKCSLKILTWFTYIIVHNNKHKIPLIHFKTATKSSSISSMLRVRWMKFRGLFSFRLIPDPSPSNDWNRFCRGRCRVDGSFLHVQNGGDKSCVFCGKNHIWSPIERMSDRWTTPSPPGCFIWQFCRKVVAKSWCCGMKMLYFLNLIL